MVRFIVIGYGWRADFFYRIAKELPEQFEICGAVLRTPERAAQVQAERGVFATSSLEEALATKPDFAVLCVPRAIVKDYLIKLMKADMPVLCETPPGSNVQELNELWQAKEKYQGKIQVVEQYFLQPLYASLLNIIGSGVIGEVSNVSLSALHGYHAVSMFRKLLGTGFEGCSISGRRFSFPVTASGSRGGADTSGNIKTADRDLAVFEFDSGKAALMDFSGEQYHSLIRTRRLNIQGLRGEINDMEVRYLNQKNEARLSSLQRLDEGLYNNSGWYHRGMIFKETMVYENPFPGARLNDDEIAVADCLKHMGDYVRTGEDFYPLQEALYDTYLAFLMEEAIQTGETLRTVPQRFSHLS